MMQTETDETITSRAPAKPVQSTKPPEALLTRKELAGYISNELGRPMSFSTLTKLCALGEGPPVYEWWGASRSISGRMAKHGPTPGPARCALRSGALPTCRSAGRTMWWPRAMWARTHKKAPACKDRRINCFVLG